MSLRSDEPAERPAGTLPPPIFPAAGASLEKISDWRAELLRRRSGRLIAAVADEPPTPASQELRPPCVSEMYFEDFSNRETPSHFPTRVPALRREPARILSYTFRGFIAQIGLS